MAAPGLTDIGVVFFDAGHTLLRPEPSVEQRYAETAARHGVVVDPALIRPRFAQLWKEGRERRESLLYKTDAAGTKRFWHTFVHEVFEPWLDGTVDFDAFFEQLYEDFATRSAWVLFDDARPCLRELRRRGFRLGVISNWDNRLGALLDRLEVTSFFDGIVASAEVGYEKPARQIFSAALESLDVEPSACLHVGDSFEDDVEGARAAGIHPVLIDRGGEHAAPGDVGSYLVVGSLAELPPLLPTPSR